MTSSPHDTPNDSAELPDVCKRLMDYVTSHGVAAALLAPGVPMPTVPLAAAAIGVREDQIIKSLLFRDAGDHYVLVIARGPARIDKERLAKAAGLTKPRLADPDTVLAVTGFPAGGVAPVGHATPVRVIVETSVAAMDVVYGGGGIDDVLVRISPADIIRLTGAEVIDLS